MNCIYLRYHFSKDLPSSLLLGGTSSSSFGILAGPVMFESKIKVEAFETVL